LPKKFQFFFIVDFVIRAEDIDFLPVKNILMSAYSYMYDRTSQKRMSQILLNKQQYNKFFMDSGVMPAAKRKDWKYFDNIKGLIKFYEAVKPDYVVGMDVPMYPFVIKSWVGMTIQQMLDKTIENAKEFAKWKPSWDCVKVFPLQGTTPKEYVDSFHRYARAGIFKQNNVGIAFGGLATRGIKYQKAVISAVMKDPIYREYNNKLKLIHGFGIGNPDKIIELYKLGVYSFDALTTCILTNTGLYWIRNGKYARHLLPESPLSRRVRLYFNIVSFWGQLIEKFAKHLGKKLKQEQEDIKLDQIEEFYETSSLE